MELCMVRIGAIFIALCMVLIAGSAGAVLHFRFGFDLTLSALAAVAVMAVLALYSAVAGREADRAAVNDQVASLTRSSGDLADVVAEFGRRLDIVESKTETVLDRAASTAQPLAAEIEELSRLVKHLADTVASHEVALQQYRDLELEPLPVQGAASHGLAPAAPAAAGVADRPPPMSLDPPAANKVAAFHGLDRDGIIALVRAAIETNKIELYLQPIVSLPQRKVRYYEAVSRLKAENGEVVAAGDFLPYAAVGGLLPKLDSLSVTRCVQVIRRLLLKNREIGLFCNLAVATLTDAGFPQLLEFIEANRAIASSLVFEFGQGAVRAMGPIEHESLAALAQRGFRFSMDNLTDLRIDPRELNDRGFRFVKAPAALLLNRAGEAGSNIHPADFSDLLGRFGIDLIAERIENESTVVDLLDYDVRFGQGFLFSPPRPVRPEALGPVGEGGKAESPNVDLAAAAPGEAVSAMRNGGTLQFARAGNVRK
jgi:cyclic-di-GMP phosphodiesterase, flagellum assembly factor TipF